MTAHFSAADLICSRRTIKHFKEDPISIDVIKELLSIAVWAPNHKMREPWRFIAFLDEGKEQLINAWKQDKESGKFPRPMKPEKFEQLKKIPAFIVVVMPVDPRPTIFEEDLAAASACIQNLQLVAWERGIGMLWNTDNSIYSPVFREPLGVKPGEKIVAILQMGYPEMTPKAQERAPIDEKLIVINKSLES